MRIFREATMSRRIRQYVRDAALAFLVVFAVLLLQGEMDRKKTVKQMAEAYKSGVAVGILAGRADRLTPAVQAQLLNICNQSWPDTTDGAEARRRACGVSDQIARANQ
jgi:hypothetical protein